MMSSVFTDGFSEPGHRTHVKLPINLMVKFQNVILEKQTVEYLRCMNSKTWIFIYQNQSQST